jgi:tetratricopeptide (TPR) repeat protein/transcriptional regulator with XRE-family HTH domain
MATVQTLTFAELLKRYRRAASLTQEELAERARMSAHTISQLERGTRRAPRKDTLALLAQALGLSAGERALLEAAARRRGTTGPPTSPSHPATASASSGEGGLAFPASLPPLVGRAAELARLERHLAGEGPPLLLLAGEPGIGKSRVLQEAAVRAGEHGLHVVAGGCHRRSAREPYAPFPDALSHTIARRSPAQQRRDLQGCAWLVRLLPELAETAVAPAPTWALPAEQERRLMFAAVGRYLANVASPAGTLLLLDDLQWAGADALDLLATLVRAPAERPLRVAVAYRDTEVRAQDPLAMLLADLTREGLAAHMALGPLAADEAAELLAELLAEPTESQDALAYESALRKRALQRAGGVPFFVISCAQELRVGSPPGGASGSHKGGVPWSAAASIRQRVAILPETTQELLGAAAVVGRRAPRAVVLAVAAADGLSEREALAALDAACRARLLVEEGEEDYQFAHDLIQEAVAAELSTARRAALHRQVAEALEQAVPLPERARQAGELAWHFVRGGERARALPYALAAGDQAEALYAHHEAERHYRAAHDLARAAGDRARQAEAAEKLGNLLVGLARYDDARAALEQAAEAYRAAGDLEGVRRATAPLAELYAVNGPPEHGRALVRPLLEAAEQSQDAPTANVARLYLALVWLSADPAERLAAARRAATIALAVGDARLLAEAEFTRGNTLLALGRMEEAGRTLEKAAPLLEAAGDLRRLCSALNVVADTYLRRGMFGEMRRASDRALEVAERVGMPAQLAFTCINHGEVAYYAGDWLQAQADFERADALYREAGVRSDSGLASWGLGLLHLAHAEWDKAAQALEEATAIAEASGEGRLEMLQLAQSALAERDLMLGNAEAARDRLEPLIERVEREHALVTRLLPPLAWAHLELGAPDRAWTVVEEALMRATAEPQQTVLVEALRVRGMVALRRERWEEAEAALEEALALARSMPYPYAEARALYTYGLLRIARDEPERARERLAAAREILRGLGERLYAERIERALADLDRG